MSKPKQDDPEQSRRFLELAREHEAEGDAAALAHAVKKLAAEPRKKQTNKKPAKGR
jgi:hypothetical protein